MQSRRGWLPAADAGHRPGLHRIELQRVDAATQSDKHCAGVAAYGPAAGVRADDVARTTLANRVTVASVGGVYSPSVAAWHAQNARPLRLRAWSALAPVAAQPSSALQP